MYFSFCYGLLVLVFGGGRSRLFVLFSWDVCGREGTEDDVRCSGEGKEHDKNMFYGNV